MTDTSNVRNQSLVEYFRRDKLIVDDEEPSARRRKWTQERREEKSQRIAIEWALWKRNNRLLHISRATKAYH